MHQQLKLFRTPSHRRRTRTDRTPAIRTHLTRRPTYQTRATRYTLEPVRTPDRTDRTIVPAARLTLLTGHQPRLADPNPDGLRRTGCMPSIAASDHKVRRRSHQRATQPRRHRTDQDQEPLGSHSPNTTQPHAHRLKNTPQHRPPPAVGRVNAVVPSPPPICYNHQLHGARHRR